MSRLLEEIREQPAALERLLRREFRPIERFKRILAGRRPKVAIVAAVGSSANAAQFARYLIELTTGIPVSIAATDIYSIYAAKLDLAEALVLGISQSGEASETIKVLAQAKEQGAFTASITNESGSTMATMVDYAFVVSVGKEKTVTATKSFTGELLMIYLLAYALGAEITLDKVKRLPDLVSSSLELEKEIIVKAGRYVLMRHAVVLGGGLNFATSLEFAAKLREICYVVSDAFSYSEFLHGPIAILETSFPLFCFLPNGKSAATTKSVCERIRAIGAETTGITDRSSLTKKDLYVQNLIVVQKRLEEEWTPIPYIILGQLFAAHLAEAKGLNPDQPRALSKTTLRI